MKVVDIRVCGFAVALVVACGCSGGNQSSGLALVPATGVVKVDGKGVGGIILAAIPNDDRGAKVGYGVTEPDGSFSLQISESESGVKSGKYRMSFRKFAMPDGSAVPEGQSPTDAGAKNALPPRYADHTTSEVFVDFPAPDGKPIAIALRSRGR